MISWLGLPTFWRRHIVLWLQKTLFGLVAGNWPNFLCFWMSFLIILERLMNVLHIDIRSLPSPSSRGFLCKQCSLLHTQRNKWRFWATSRQRKARFQAKYSKWPTDQWCCGLLLSAKCWEYHLLGHLVVLLVRRYPRFCKHWNLSHIFPSISTVQTGKQLDKLTTSAPSHPKLILLEAVSNLLSKYSNIHNKQLYPDQFVRSLHTIHMKKIQKGIGETFALIFQTFH